MIEELSEFPVEVASEILTEIIKKSTDGIIDWGKNKSKKYDLFGKASKKYAKNLFEEHNWIRVFGMDKPIKLLDLYVRITILSKITKNNLTTIEQLQAEFDKNEQSFGTKKKTLTAEEVVSSFNKFIVLGKPGAGKSTLLKYYALSSAIKKNSNNRIPVFISLKSYSEGKLNLIEYINFQFEKCSFSGSDEFVKRLLEKGSIQILLDGLDEVQPENLDDIIQEINNFSNKYRENQFIISCRIAAYNHWFEKFTDVEIADFDTKQIKNFVSNWFNNDTETAIKCYTKILEENNLKELSSTPLLLSLLCITYDEILEFPNNRAELYEVAISALLKKWDSTRRINRKSNYKFLSLKRKEMLFSNIAVKTFEKGNYFFKKRVLIDLTEKYIGNLPLPAQVQDEIDFEEIINETISQHGIFIERAKGIYSFSHLTFQEYFTALYITIHSNQGSLNKLVGNYFFETRWRDIFLIASGMLYDANSFITQMKNKIDEELLEKEYIRKYISFSNSIISDKSNPINRIIALKNLAIYTAFMIDTPKMNSLKGLCDSLNEKLKNLGFEVEKRNYIKVYEKNIANLRDSVKEIITDNDKLDNLNKYLVGCNLLIDCILSDAIISEEIKKHTINNILSIEKQKTTYNTV